MKIFDLIKMANEGDLFDGAIMKYNDMEFEFNGIKFVGRKNDYYFPYAKLFDSDFLEEEVDLFYEVVRKAHSFRGGMDSTFIL